MIKYFAEHTDEIDGNIILVAECGEEDNSKGVITSLDELVDLKAKECFEYVCCINSDYTTFVVLGDENCYVYYETIIGLIG